MPKNCQDINKTEGTENSSFLPFLELLQKKTEIQFKKNLWTAPPVHKLLNLKSTPINFRNSVLKLLPIRINSDRQFIFKRI